MRKIVLSSFVVLSTVLAAAGPSWALNLERLSENDIRQVKELVKTLEPYIQKRYDEHNLARLTFAELYANLTDKQKKFLQQFTKLDAGALGVKIPFRGFATGEEELVMIKGQKVKVREEEKKTIKSDMKTIPVQFLPADVHRAVMKMMDAMENDIGKRLLVESGYRASAYQLYLFVYYLRNHDYSIRETVKFVALPGYSEHGSPKFQAVDFVNSDGINGENDASEFEALEEYRWLLKNARRFGFVESYPKNASSGITYEPWHWRHEGGGQKEKSSGKKPVKPQR